MVNNPAATLGLLGGTGMVLAGASGELAAVPQVATGVGIPTGAGTAAGSTALIGAGLALAGASGAAIVQGALGADQVTGAFGNPFGDTFTAPTMIDGNEEEWDRNDQWERVNNLPPNGEGIAHDGSSRVHIPYGTERSDGTWSGGHWREAGVPNKTVFPEGWTPERILQETLDVARNPNQAPELTERNTWVTRGTRDGVLIEVILKEDGTVITGYPISGPGVESTDEDGDPHP